MEQGDVREVFEHPKHSYTKKLLNSTMTSSKLSIQGQQTIMKAENLNVSYPLKKNLWGRVTKSLDALKNVCFSLYKGETLGIVGESGSGKTTLAMCLADLCKYDGEVFFDGINGKNVLDFHKKIQIVFQDPFNSLNPRMTVGQIVGEGLEVFERKLDKNQKYQRIIKILRDVELTESDFYKYPHEFSGGQRQRIAIARALIVNPEIIILDEPTSALDVTIQKQILTLLLRLQKEKNLSYIFISHDMHAVEVMSDRIAVMKDGEIVEVDSSWKILNEPHHKYTKKLIAASL